MELLIHEFPALYSILKAHKGPTVGAAITGHALRILKTLLYRHYLFFRWSCLYCSSFKCGFPIITLKLAFLFIIYGLAAEISCSKVQGFVKNYAFLKHGF